jgi:hypothetical protein
MPTFLCGHGNWYPVDGFTRVPPDTKVTFYTQNAKTLWMQEAVKILDGTTQFTERQLDVYTASQAVPQMTLSDAGADWRAKCELAASHRTDAWKLVFADAGSPKKLGDIMNALKGEELVWVACRELHLKKVIGMVAGQNTVVGANLGVNMRENPTTLYSAYVCASGGRPGNHDKATFRGFMPAGWNIPRKPVVK